MKTVSARIRRSTTELEEMGESTDDLANGFSKYADEIQALTGFDIRVEGTLDTYKDIFEIFDGISAVWDDLTDTQQSRVAEILGGTRQLQVIASIMNNWEDAQNAYADAMDSANVAEEAQETHMESLEAKTEQFDASMQELYKDFLDSDFAKSVVDWGTNFVQQIDSMVDSCGSLSTAIVALGVAASVSSIAKAIATMGKFGSFQAAFDLTGLGHIISLFEELGNTVGSVFAGIIFQGQSLSAGLATIGANFTSLLSCINPVILALAGFAAMAAVLNSVKKHYEDLRKSAEDASNTWADSNDTIEGYKSRIKELDDQLSSGNLTDEESYEAKSELLSIQDTLIGTFGDEAEALDLVNGEYQDQIDLINELSSTKAYEYLKDNEDEIDEAIDKMEDFGKYEVDVASFLNKETADAVREALEEAGISEDFDWGTTILGQPTNGLKFNVGVDTKDALEDLKILKDIYSDLENEYGYQISDTNWLMLDEYIQSAEDYIDNWEKIYNTYLDAAVVADRTLYGAGLFSDAEDGKTASKILEDYSYSIEAYNEALESGSDKDINKARENYQGMHDDIHTLINDSNELNEEGMNQYAQQVKILEDDLNQASIDSYNFKEAVQGINIEDDVDQQVNDIANKLKELGYTDIELKTRIVEVDSAGYEKNIYANLMNLADQFGLSMDEVVDILVETGVVASSTADGIEDVGVTLQDVFANEELDIGGAMDNVKSEISDVNGMLDDVRNGEEIDISDLIANYGVSGNLETLESELTDYEVKAVKDFVNQYNEAISEIEDPDQLASAQILLNDILSSLDLSNIDFSDYKDVGEQIIDNVLSGTDNEWQRVGKQAMLRSLIAEYEGDEDILEIMYRISLDSSSADYVYDQWQDRIHEMEKEEEEIVLPTGTISDMFVDAAGNETAFRESLDNYETDIETLNEAMSQIHLGENLDLDQLLTDIPELSAYVGDLEEGISKVSFDKLKDMSSDFADTLSSEIEAGMSESQAQAITEEFAEWIASADLSGLDFSGIWDQVKEGASESEQGVLEDIFGQYGENEFTAEVFYKLSLIPGAEGWSPEEIEEWFDKEYNLMVVARVDGGQLDKLSSDLDKIQTQADKIQNEMDRNDIFGIRNGEQQYRDLINNSNLEIQNLRQQLSLWEAIARAVDPLSSEYAEAQSEIANIESEINSALSSQQEWNQAAAELRNAEGEALSAYNDATSTRNAGDNYDDIRSALESVNELWEEGKTGTDEFLAGTALASSAGIQDIENWESNYANMMRYFTEDTSGCINALQDLSEATNSAGEAMAKYDETTGEWTYRVDDIQRAADVLGISTENMVALMGRMEDYGGRNIWFETVEDGIAQTAELYSDLAQAEIDLQNMERKQQADMKEYGESSITDEMIQSQKDNITTLKEWTYESNNLLSDLSSKSTEELEASMNAQYAAMTSMLDMASEIGDERVRNTYLQDIATWAQENGLNIADLFTYDDSTGQVSGLVDGALEELKETYDSDLYNMDLTSPMAEAAQDIGDTLTSNLADSESGVQEIVDSIISDFTEADLAGIEFNTGSLTEGYEEAESAMDNLLSAMGLGQEEGEALAQIMSSYMQLGDWDAAIQSVVESYGSLDTTLQQAQENGIISPDINLEANISEMSLDECQSGIEDLTAQKATIEADAELDPTVKESLENQIDLLIDSYQDREIELGINQAVESGEMSLEDIINNPENLIATLGIEVDGEEQLEQLTSEVQSVATNMQQEQQLQLKVDAIIEGNEDISSVDDLLNLPEEELAVKCGLEMDSAELAQFESYIGYEEVEVPVTMQLEESQFEALTSQTEKVDVEVNTDDIAGQIESAVASASPTVDVTANVDDIAGQIEAAASGIEITVPVAIETSGAEVDTVSTAAPQSTSVTVTASVSGEGEVNSLTSAIESVNSKYVAVTANVNGTAEVRSLISAINSVTGKVVSVSAVVSGIGEVNSLAASIAAVQSKTVTVTTVTQTVSGSGVNEALGTAHVSGTAYSMWAGYRHSIGAYADGSTQDWALPKNEQAIVNEIGTESIVRDGKWFMIPGGAHVESLKRGDIVLLMRTYLATGRRILSNCWDTLKLIKLQRDDEKYASVNAAKAEKID